MNWQHVSSLLQSRRHKANIFRVSSCPVEKEPTGPGQYGDEGLMTFDTFLVQQQKDDDQVLSYDEFVHQVHSNVDRTSWTAPEYSANTPEGHPQTYAAMSVLESEGNLETYEEFSNHHHPRHHVLVACDLVAHSRCSVCYGYVWNVSQSKQGFRCQHCHRVVHRKCLRNDQTACPGDKPSGGKGASSSNESLKSGSRSSVTSDLGHSPPTKYGHAPGGRGGSYENTLPVEVEYRGHVLTHTITPSPIFCCVCDDFIWVGSKTPALMCKGCLANCHKDCHVKLGDCIRAHITHAHIEPGLQRSVSAPQVSRTKSFLSEFDYGHTILGVGAFGVVQTCYEKKTGRSHAVKTINKRRFQFRPRVLQSLQHELEVVSKLSHPSIVRVECCFETADQIQIVMELMPGGDLLDYMLNKHTHRLAEKEARSVMWQVLQAVDYLHGRHIAHRDLKPDNILLIRSMTPADRDVDPPTPVIVKVADFGFAHAVHDLGRTITMIGTPAYLAPEILARSGPYGLAVDMWSLGVLLYIVLSGQLPFNHDPSGLPSIHLGELLNDQALKFTSFEVRDLICGLLCVDPRQRLNIYQAINSPWFRL